MPAWALRLSVIVDPFLRRVNEPTLPPGQRRSTGRLLHISGTDSLSNQNAPQGEPSRGDVKGEVAGRSGFMRTDQHGHRRHRLDKEHGTPDGQWIVVTMDDGTVFTSGAGWALPRGDPRFSTVTIEFVATVDFYLPTSNPMVRPHRRTSRPRPVVGRHDLSGHHGGTHHVNNRRAR
jgi:hypothetical protein